MQAIREALEQTRQAQNERFERIMDKLKNSSGDKVDPMDQPVPSGMRNSIEEIAVERGLYPSEVEDPTAGAPDIIIESAYHWLARPQQEGELDEDYNRRVLIYTRYLDKMASESERALRAFTFSLRHRS
ncbi:hypothetical protein SCP_0706530 [Sparassis crispa]|uniref:Uncharacterized protein n=1 Tax=Sparassis crispa TaxID=139825 RepID=A0A401GTD1_9APHY|nr:hypothetical protein SCP_0706530 [Sparassis crispa]GBE85466.1 hypothetical protein SCP_0706530 [Sparassis crispa]